MRFLRFDLRSTRLSRLQTNKFALISAVWDKFVENCIVCYKPGENITVDEQLFPTKARCRFTQYMANKPDKFGIKFWIAVDLESKYILNAIPYLGKDETRPAMQRLSESVVMKLMEPYLSKGRNVTTDNFFTSIHLAIQLRKKKDVTCRDPKQNTKGSSATGKNFTAEQIYQQTLANKKRKQPSHNVDSLPVQTKEERLYS